MAQQPYTTFQELKPYLKITDSSEDAYLKLLIPKVMGFIDRYTHRTFGWGNPNDITDLTNFKDVTTEQGCSTGEAYDGLSGKTIYLNRCDIASVEEVRLGAFNIDNYTILQVGNYIWRDDGRIILGGNFFSAGTEDSNFFNNLATGYQSVKVKYHYGYYGVPEEVSLACLEICAALYTLRKSLGVKQERIGDWQVDYQTSIRSQLKNQPDTLGILNTLRKVNVSIMI